MPRILVIGSANVDYTVALARLPTPGETVSSGTLLVNHGGKGANQAVAARRLGAEVRLIACVGGDTAGQQVRAALEREGVGVAGVSATDEAPTGTALIMVDAVGRNLIAVAPGANRRLDIERARRCRADFEWAQVVVCQLETPLETVAWALEEARRSGALTILNPAPVPAAPVEFWPSVDYATPNTGEAARLGAVPVEDRAGAERAARELRTRGAGTVIVTLGADGALACAADGVLTVPGVAVEAVDTTAAGDAFNGALAVALADGASLTAALTFANAAGALTCTRRGAQASLPGRAEVARLLAELDRHPRLDREGAP